MQEWEEMDVDADEAPAPGQAQVPGAARLARRAARAVPAGAGTRAPHETTAEQVGPSIQQTAQG